MPDVAVDLTRVTFTPPFVSFGQFLAFRYVSGTRTLTPYLYNADGTPADTGRSSIVLASPVNNVVLSTAKRSSGKVYIIGFANRVAVDADTIFIYDLSADVWTSEVDANPVGQDDIGPGFVTDTGDDFFFQYGPAGGSLWLEKLDVGLTSRVNIGSESPAGTHAYHSEQGTVLGVSTSAGVEIDTDGTSRNPAGYDHSGVIFSFNRTFPPSTFIGERIIFRKPTPVIMRVDIVGADVTQVARSSGWFPSGFKTIELNDARNAFSVFPFAQTASPPSETLDWVDALPKTTEHASSVEIRPVDYVSPGSPGTLAELPDAVFALGAGP